MSHDRKIAAGDTFGELVFDFFVYYLQPAIFASSCLDAAITFPQEDLMPQ